MEYTTKQVGNKTITTIYVITDKKKEPKVVEGTYETVVLFSVPCGDEEKENKKSSNNKLSQEIIDEIYDLNSLGSTVSEISALLKISKQTVYTYLEKIEEAEDFEEDEEEEN